MGRIKTTLIKRTSHKIFREDPGKFKKNFEENKKIVADSIDTESKKLKNIIAGYVTRLAKKQQL
ncbi:30S ribosomal protein S17e [archaeon]|nr:30S ribosomal protein S17e [archaeon]